MANNGPIGKNCPNEEQLNEKEENSKNDKEIENLESKVFELEDKLMKAHESVKG